jgi:hypothetical protein
MYRRTRVENSCSMMKRICVRLPTKEQRLRPGGAISGPTLV